MKFTPSLVTFLLTILIATNSGAQGWQWGKGATGGDSDGWPVATDKYGNVFCAALRSGSSPANFGTVIVPFSGTSSQYQCIIAKYDASGSFQWATGTEYGDAELIGIATTPDGSVYLYGSFDSGEIKIGAYKLDNSFHKGFHKFFLARIDPFGTVQWATSDGNTQYIFDNPGGIFTLLGLGAITTDNAGNAYITANFSVPSINIGGSTLTNSDPTGKTDDIFIAKYDPTGAVVWATSLGGSKNDDAYAITTTSAGDVYVAGDFASPVVALGASSITNSGTAPAAFIARLTSSGSPVWGSASGGTGREYASGLASDASGNIYMVGGFRDNSITFAGSTIYLPYPNSNPALNGAALYFIKFDASNNLVWSKTIGSPDNGGIWGYSVALSDCGNIWISGAMMGDTGSLPVHMTIGGVDFASLPGSYDPAFMACFTSSGSYVDCQLLQSGGDDEVGLACDLSGNVFICGDYKATSSFSIGATSFPSDSNPREFLYLAKYSSPGLSQGRITHLDTAFCFNPGITVNAPPGHASYVWSDGKTGMNHRIADTGTIWVRADDSCGIYTVDSFRVTSYCDCNKSMFIPNSFTPNGDGINDVFYPRSGNPNIKIKNFRIYNRWGDLLFERDNLMVNDAGNAWDGTFQGNMPLPDVYVYIVEAECENGDAINKKGSVTVIR